MKSRPPDDHHPRKRLSWVHSETRLTVEEAESEFTMQDGGRQITDRHFYSVRYEHVRRFCF